MKGISTYAPRPVGIISGHALTDLSYEEDSKAEVDLNIVMNEAGKLVEIQGTAEGVPFNSDQLQVMLALARKGVFELIEHQKAFLEEFG